MALPAQYARENIAYDFGKAMYFPGDANGQIFRGGTDHDLDFNPAAKFTMGGWLKMVDNNRVNIFMQKKANGTSGYLLLMARESNVWTFSWQEAKGFTSEKYVFPIDCRDPFMWGLVFDPTQVHQPKRIKVYLNGDLLNNETHKLSSLTQANLVANTSSTFFLGGDFNLQNLLGYQDNVFLHQGVAYSTEEMARTYYLREPAVEDPTMFWNFNSQVGNVIPDNTGNGHDLTMANNVSLQDGIFGHGWTRDAY